MVLKKYTKLILKAQKYLINHTIMLKIMTCMLLNQTLVEQKARDSSAAPLLLRQSLHCFLVLLY